MSVLALLRSLFAYQAWANDELLEKLASLDPHVHGKERQAVIQTQAMATPPTPLRTRRRSTNFAPRSQRPIAGISIISKPFRRGSCPSPSPSCSPTGIRH